MRKWYNAPSSRGRNDAGALDLIRHPLGGQFRQDAKPVGWTLAPQPRAAAGLYPALAGELDFSVSRRRYSEKDVIRTLLHQGVDIRCFRTGEPITLENVDRIEREHIHEIKLDGPDVPGNCRYSLKEAHKVITHGNGATVAGSSRHRIAKATEPTRIEKFAVRKKPLDEPREQKPKFGWRRP